MALFEYVNEQYRSEIDVINLIDYVQRNSYFFDTPFSFSNSPFCLWNQMKFYKKYYQKYNLILLTCTNDEKYQLNKIKSSNISKCFKEIIITTKDKSKLDNIDYQNGIFIDNNPIELERFYNSNATYLIRIKRTNDKYSKLNLNIKNIPTYKEFNELLENKLIEILGDDKNE